MDLQFLMDFTIPSNGLNKPSMDFTIPSNGLNKPIVDFTYYSH